MARRRRRGGPSGGSRRRMARGVRVVLMLLALGGIVGGYASRYLDLGGGGAGAAEAPAGGEDGRLRVPVLRVIDGDTIVAKVDGREERIRYIGIDTPETHHPRIGEEPFGREATEANRALVGDGPVELAFDVERRDDYGRLLAYVYLPDGTFVNAVLVEDGYAQIMTVPPNVRHADLFRRLEREARDREAGLWGHR
ncbi:MAG: thermonuclease family protein [Myxococcota bacterium]